jgi:hypothetical protein
MIYTEMFGNGLNRAATEKLRFAAARLILMPSLPEAPISTNSQKRRYPVTSDFDVRILYRSLASTPAGLVFENNLFPALGWN